MKNMWKENKILCSITLLATIIVVSYYASINLPEVISGIDIWFKLSADLSIGVLINFIFFVFQIYLPQLSKGKKAFAFISKKLEALYFEMSDIMLATESNVLIQEDAIKI